MTPFPLPPHSPRASVMDWAGAAAGRGGHSARMSFLPTDCGLRAPASRILGATP